MKRVSASVPASSGGYDDDFDDFDDGGGSRKFSIPNLDEDAQVFAAVSSGPTKSKSPVVFTSAVEQVGSAAFAVKTLKATVNRISVTIFKNGIFATISSISC